MACPGAAVGATSIWSPPARQAFEGASQQRAAPTASCRRIHDCEIGFPQSFDPMCGEMGAGKMPARQPPAEALLYNPTTAERSTDFAISSASTCRLIFMEAVRGKSFSQTRYPPTRLKSGKRRLRDNSSSSNVLSNV